FWLAPSTTRIGYQSLHCVGGVRERAIPMEATVKPTLAREPVPCGLSSGTLHGDRTTQAVRRVRVDWLHMASEGVAKPMRSAHESVSVRRRSFEPHGQGG